MTEHIAPTRLFGVPGAERLYDTAASYYETELDPYFDDRAVPQHPEHIIEEWDVHDPIDHVPSAAMILYWLCEHIGEEITDPDAAGLDRLERDEEALAAAEALRATLAGKISWRMARDLLATHKLTWDDQNEPLLDGEPLYQRRAPRDPETTDA